MTEPMAVNPNLSRAVDAYFTETIVAPDKALEEALAANAAAGLPAIDVSAPQGKLIHLLARMTGARKALEIGALGGYSTIWIASALPDDGRLVTLEWSEKHAEVARRNVARAGLSAKVEVRTGSALKTLPRLEAEGLGPFDFVFIDADKSNNDNYLAWALRLSRPGTVIVVDNVVRDGAIVDRAPPDPGVAGIRRMFEMMAREPRLAATAIQTVGAKGWDGFALAIVE
jgi:predicted O-methyltransferase YrrM